MATVKFSEFVDGAEVQVGDTVVGLRSGVNYKFSFPSDGMKDANGSYLFKYSTTGIGAVNYVEIVGTLTNNGPQLNASGSDANVDLNLSSKGSGNIVLDSLKWPSGDGTNGQVLTTDGSGNLSFDNAITEDEQLTQIFMYMGA